MKKIKIYFLWCSIFCLAQCTKIELPPPSEGEPIFTFSATIDGTPTNLQAGIDDYYMFTSFEKDTAEVVTFIGTLQQQNCADTCRESIRIEIRDIERSSNSIIDNALQTKEYVYHSPNQPITSTVYQTRFNAQAFSNQFNDFTYEWFFDDNNASSQLANPVYDYETPGIYAVELICRDANGCESSQIQNIHLENPDIQCGINIQGQIVQNSFLQLEAWGDTIGGNDTFLWDNMQDSSNIVLIMDSGQQCVSYSNNLQCQSQACAGVSIMNDISPNIFYCTTTFNYQVEKITTIETPALQLGTVTVIYKNEVGITYRSDKIEQTPASKFTINRVDNFDENEKGEKTKKLTIDLQALLMDEAGNVVELLNGETVIAVAVP